MTRKKANRVRWIAALILFLCTAGIYELAKHAPGLLMAWYWQEIGNKYKTSGTAAAIPLYDSE